MKECLKNYTRSCGSRGAASAANTACSSGRGTAATPSGWDFAIKYELFNKIGGGFYFYGLGNPDSKWWDETPKYYDLQVYYYSDGEVYTNSEGKEDIRNKTNNYILNITNQPIEYKFLQTLKLSMPCYVIF